MSVQLQLLFIVCLLLVSSVFGKDLSRDEFDEIVKDERVLAVEFYSPMCGSCKEFAGTWAQLETKLKSVITAKVNIDTAHGMDIAKTQQVLEEGIPNVRLYKSSGGKSVSLMKGDLRSAKDLLQHIRAEVNTLNRRDDGFFLKAP